MVWDRSQIDPAWFTSSVNVKASQNRAIIAWNSGFHASSWRTALLSDVAVGSHLFRLRIKMSGARGEMWSDGETLPLINAWSDRKILEKLQGCHRNSDIYTTIAEILKKEGFLERHWKQCRTKCKHLKTQYKKIQDGLGKSGNSRKRKLPKFYDLMDNFLGDRPEAVGLENAIDTSIGINSEASCSEICTLACFPWHLWNISLTYSTQWYRQSRVHALVKVLISIFIQTV